MKIGFLDTIFTIDNVCLELKSVSVKRSWTITIYCLLFACLSISWIPLSYVGPASLHHSVKVVPSIDPANAETSSLYEFMGLESLGLSKQAFTYAYKGYRKLVAKNKITEGAYLAICDFSQSSKNKRFLSRRHAK